MLDPGIGNPVPDGLAFPPGGDDPLLAHPGEVLRQGRLRQPDRLGELSDIGFPHSTSLHRIISRRSFARARRMSATSVAFFSKLSKSSCSEAGIGLSVV